MHIINRFVSKAIQQTNCEFDWDGVDNKRSAIMFKKKFTEKDLDDFDKFEKYIATPSGSEDENAETYKVSLFLFKNIDKFIFL